MPGDTWSLVLAGGAGRRLRGVTGNTPKQFWKPDGRQSLVEATIERLATVAPRDRTVTVVDRSHRPFIDGPGAPSTLGHVVYQPTDRGTAAGVLLGLMTIMNVQPEAIIVLTPSDHGISNVPMYRAGVRNALCAIDRGQADIVLFGVAPDHPAGDYGWITPRELLMPADLQTVASFVEKPSPREAERLWRDGAVWNAMVIAARAQALADLYRQHLPSLFAIFTAAALQARAEGTAVRVDYGHLPAHDFSHDLLTPAADLSLMVWPRAMGWSDLGTPERLRDWQERVPIAHIRAPAAVTAA